MTLGDVTSWLVLDLSFKVRAQRKFTFYLLPILMHSMSWLDNIKTYISVIFDLKGAIKGDRAIPTLFPTQRDVKGHCDVTGRVPKS